RTPDGGAIGMRVDITELKQREIWLRELFEANPMPMLLCDGDNLAILQVNTAAADFYGFDKAELATKTPLDLHAEDQRSDFAAALASLDDPCHARTIWRQWTADGRQVHVLIYVRLIREGTSTRLLFTIADVSDRICAEQEANRLAHHDPLTGLPNRMQFYKALEDGFKTQNEDELVVYCLDLDGFKPVNDTFGHAAGDAVLVEVAERLRQQEGEFLVARLGGDEFAILFRTSTSSKSTLADRCLAAFERPFIVKGLPIRIGVSIGIASAPTDGNNGEALIQAADRALYIAKEAGRGIWKLASDSHAPRDATGRRQRLRSRKS
ncbi:MAG: sensor domain-containing diguanylate cyclase, partial [Verrucomicrobiaceae bacterium]